MPKIRVSNGQETLSIEPGDLENAKADGYLPVDAGSNPNWQTSSTTVPPILGKPSPEALKQRAIAEIAAMKDPYNEIAREQMKGAARGITYGISDPVFQGAEAAMDAATTDKDLLRAFLERRRNERARTARAKAAGLGVEGAETLGALGTGFLMPGRAAPGMAKSVLGGMGKAAALGAAGGFGMSNADVLTGTLDDWEQATQDALSGGLMAGGIGVGGSTVNKLLSRRLPQRMAETAENRMTKAITGQNKRGLMNLVESGRLDMEHGSTLGRAGLDEGLARGLIPPDVNEIARRAQAKRQLYGGQIGEGLDAIDVVFRDSAGNPNGVNPANIARNIRRDRAITGTRPTQENRNLLAAAQEQAEDYGRMEPMGAREAQTWKDSHQWGGPPEGGALTRKGLSSVYKRAVGNEIKDTAARALENTGDSLRAQKAALQQYPTAMEKFGPMAEAEELARFRATGDFSNRMVSPSDYGSSAAMGAGLLARGMDPVTTSAISAGTGALNNFLRTRGNAGTANILDKTSRALFFGIDKLGKYGPLLVNMAKRLNVPMAAAHAMLAEQDPNYRDLANQVLSQGGQP